jgi:hypothetical protein
MVSWCRGIVRCVDGKRKEYVVIGWLEGSMYQPVSRCGEKRVG